MSSLNSLRYNERPKFPTKLLVPSNITTDNLKNYLSQLLYIAIASPLFYGCVSEENYNYVPAKKEVITKNIEAALQDVVKNNDRKGLVLHLVSRKHIDVSSNFNGVSPRFFVSREIPRQDDIFYGFSDLYNDDNLYGNGSFYLGIANAPKGRIEVEFRSIDYQHNKKSDNLFLDIFDNNSPCGIEMFLVNPEGEGRHEVEVKFRQNENIFAFGGFYLVLSSQSNAHQ